jgi:hypothetical protein
MILNEPKPVGNSNGAPRFPLARTKGNQKGSSKGPLHFPSARAERDKKQWF